MAVSERRWLELMGYISEGCWSTEAEAESFAQGLRGEFDVVIRGPNQYRRGFEVFSLYLDDDDFDDGS